MPYPEQRGALLELLLVAQALRSAPVVTPSLDFRVDARQQLIARLPSRRSRRAVLVNVFSGAWRRRLVVSQALLLRVTVIFLVGVVLGSSVAVAAAQSLPNDVLYPVKRTIEQARLAFAPDSASSGDLRLEFAAERLAEVQRLIDRGRGSEAAIAIDDFTAQMQSAASTAHNMPDTLERATLMVRVNESSQSSDAVLSRTQARLPESAQVAVKRARAVLAERPDDPHNPPPLVLPLVSTVAPFDRTPTPHSTPVPSMTLPSVTRDTPRWRPTPVEQHPINPPAFQPTRLPTHQPTAVPTNQPQRSVLRPPRVRTQAPPPTFPTDPPPSVPTSVPAVKPSPPPAFVPPQSPISVPHFGRSGSGGRP